MLPLNSVWQHFSLAVKKTQVILFRFRGSLLQLVAKAYSICPMNNAHQHISSFMSFGADQGFAAADTCARPLSLLLLLGLSGDRRAR